MACVNYQALHQLAMKAEYEYNIRSVAAERLHQ